MKILTYKRTHTGDPENSGIFGGSDCMGKVRGYSFDAAIGVGGWSAWPRSEGIAGKLTWVGIGPTKLTSRILGRGPVVTFSEFWLWDADGPAMRELAPALWARFETSRCRLLLYGYNDIERAEAVSILDWARMQPPTLSRKRVGENLEGRVRPCRSRCPPRGCRRVKARSAC